MTKRLEEFDFEVTCRALEGVAESSPEEARGAIELAAYALHFLYATDQFKAFREYLHDVKEPATREVRIEREFDNMAQAREWLNGSPPEPGVHVKVGGTAYELWRDTEGKLRLVPSVSPKDL
ncbi:hypothetical protein [Stigmatella ashevillensis]|uniref:hypothetical protein n=1 Tax=Stigmatella ashevillensis TaxID=2995309 RepID=UPI0027D93511|nr:hypothetical protein [Stigmatella ashevillena]